MKKVLAGFLVAFGLTILAANPTMAYEVISGVDEEGCAAAQGVYEQTSDGVMECRIYGSPYTTGDENTNQIGAGDRNNDCGVHFLGLRAWYDGLVGADCQMLSPIDIAKSNEKRNGKLTEAGGNAVMTRYVWTIVLNITTMALQIIGYLAVGFVIWGGYQYILSKGDPGKVASGKKTIMNAIIGLSICMSASIITGAISDIVSGASTAGANFFVSIFNKAFLWAGIIAAIFIVYGGIQYITSDGDPSKVAKAKNTIMNSAIGLAIVVLAALIIGLVVENMG